MKSQQVKSLLSACNPLFLFTPCSALIDLRRCYSLFKVIVAKKACPVISTFDIYLELSLIGHFAYRYIGRKYRDLSICIDLF